MSEQDMNYARVYTNVPSVLDGPPISAIVKFVGPEAEDETRHLFEILRHYGLCVSAKLHPDSTHYGEVGWQAGEIYIIDKEEHEALHGNAPKAEFNKAEDYPINKQLVGVPQ
jgi:hypothetical protein